LARNGRSERELERAWLADKVVTANEQQTVIVQRRCLRAARDIQAGEVFSRGMIAVLRPATPGGILPDEIDALIGTRALANIPAGRELRWTDVGA
jgi:N-acetylneuraminate synthase